jgi:hypothetical protein
VVSNPLEALTNSKKPRRLLTTTTALLANYEFQPDELRLSRKSLRAHNSLLQMEASQGSRGSGIPVKKKTVEPIEPVPLEIDSKLEK